MTRDHFKQTMYSPHFSSPGYEDSDGAKFEKRIISFFNIKKFFKRKK